MAEENLFTPIQKTLDILKNTKTVETKKILEVIADLPYEIIIALKAGKSMNTEHCGLVFNRWEAGFDEQGNAVVTHFNISESSSVSSVLTFYKNREIKFPLCTYKRTDNNKKTESTIKIAIANKNGKDGLYIVNSDNQKAEFAAVRGKGICLVKK